MGYLPIFLDVGGRPCVVVGGGEIAERKVENLLLAGADVTVISPIVTARLGQLIRAGRIRHFARECAPAKDLRGVELVCAAAGDSSLNRQLSRKARSLGVPINIADAPELSTFITPAVVRRGALTIAVSTNGASPAMAKRIRTRLERSFGPEYGLALAIMRRAREKLRVCEPVSQVRARKLSALAASGLVHALGRGDTATASRIVRRHTGIALTEPGQTLDASIERWAEPAPKGC